MEEDLEVAAHTKNQAIHMEASAQKFASEDEHSEKVVPDRYSLSSLQTV